MRLFLPEGLPWIPFTSGDYRVLGIDEGYRIAPVGGPDRKYLWLLSRDTDMDANTRDDFLATTRAQDMTSPT